MASLTCGKCNKTMDAAAQFYTYKDGTKTELCKKCLTMHINNFDPETFLWLLEKMDVPYIPEEWNILRDKAFAKSPNLNGMSVFGKYLGKMRLKQYMNFGWADSEKLQAEREQKRIKNENDKKESDAIIRQRLDNGEITEAQYKTLISAEVQNEEYLSRPAATPPINEISNFYQEENFIDENLLKGAEADLTEEDKIYLAMKWGRLYKPVEWIELEKKYEEMTCSFDIQDADTINTLILICKTDLKMNQALDCGDVEGFQKLSKVSNDLRKSAKFTAAQNKEEKGEFVDSVGELVAYCEKNGGAIPRFEIDEPLDIIDTVIKDLKNYTKNLISEDVHLSQLIEDYLKKTSALEQSKRDRISAKESGLEEVEISDEDYQEHFEALEEMRNEDAALFNEEGE